MISSMASTSMSQTPHERIAHEVSRLLGWISATGGIVHRHSAENAGFPVVVRRAAVRSGIVRRVKRDWLASDTAPQDLLTAAENSGRLTCVSAARRRGWWMPEDAPDDIHIRLDPHASSPTVPVTTHWTQSIAPAPRFSLLDSIEDTLAHVAVCLPAEEAQVVWNSALKVENLTPAAIRRVRWRSRQARDCAGRASDQSDSGLETILVVRLSGWGVPMRQQVAILGRPVDLLIGERLVVQIDGFAHHATSAQRSKDVAFDAELTLNGYTVLRFTYAHVVHDLDGVERTIARAIAAGAHLAS
jgi:very-short-patch-repair endonuclease